jgi:hypothetical protein
VSYGLAARMKRAGDPAHISRLGMSLVTTDPIPISDHSPTVKCSRTMAPDPM